MAARPGEWVQIQRTVLQPHERTGKLPDDTRAVPFESWSKGRLVGHAEVGDQVEIETVIGRRLRGRLVAVNPGYDHGFGHAYVPELADIAAQARRILAGGES